MDLIKIKNIVLEFVSEYQKKKELKMKKYTVKVKIPCVVYKNVYVVAESKKDAKKIAVTDLKYGNCDKYTTGDVMDYSGDYDEEQLYEKATAVKADLGYSD